MLGDTLGHYRLDEKIGSGGMGEVYRAHDEYLDRDVALKVLPAGTLADEAARKLFRKEALAIAKFNHPNIATVHEFNCQNGVDFLAMELIRGRSLKEILKEGPLQEKEIRRLGLQLAEALASAHEHGVVHRDLKPANIMITRDGRLKILDFGLAKLVQSIGGDITQSSTGVGSATGTVPYMAPEQLSGQSSDIRTDVYAAGAVLYEMATSRRAFAENNWPRLIDSILHQAPQPPCILNDKISVDMQAIILKALEKDPGKRQQSARELLLELESLSPEVERNSTLSLEQSHAPPLEIAHVLFMDIVAYSMLPMDQQRHRLRELQKTVCETSEFIRAKSADQLISLPTGDGMALVFFGDSEYPVRCALELTRSLRNNSEIRLRMGIHTGPVYRVADVNAASNVAGGGINMAQRVMDCGDAGHILLSKTEVDVLGQLSCWNCSLHDLGEAEVKHGVRVHVFNFYTDDAGNPKLPSKLRTARGSRKPGVASGSGRRIRTSDPGSAALQRPRIARKIHPVPGFPQASRAVLSISVRLRRWRWLLMVSCLIILGIAGLSISPFREWVFNIRSGTNEPPTGVPSLKDGMYLAVVPFAIDGDQKTLGYVAQGLNEELSRKLSSLRAVHLVSSADTEAIAERQNMSLKDPVETIARKLGVNLIVQGGVVEAGGWIHINAELQDVADRKRIWKRTFSDTAADVNLLNRTDEIYENIIAALKLKPSAEEQARAARPTDNIEVYDLYLKGRNAANSRDVSALGSAREFYEEALRRDPHFALAYSGLADADMATYRETNEVSWATKALGAAQQAESLNGKLPEVHLSLGTAYRELGKTAEAIAEFERAKQLSPNSDVPWRRLGRTYEAAGRMDEAVETFKKAALINPYSLSNQNELGAAYLESGQYRKALDCFSQVIKIDPDNYLAHENAGGAYFGLARYAESIAEFQEALKLEPGADIYSNLGTASLYVKKYPDAIKFSEKAAEMHPNDEAIVGNLADVYFWSGQRKRATDTYDRAIGLASKALEVNPKDANVLSDLARYYAKKGEVQLADYYITQARSDNPSNPTLIYEEAQLRAATGRPKDAIPLLRSALSKGVSPEQAKLDPEFGGLRASAEFQKLVSEFSGKTN
jgi:serine/threonine protein kinase/tetratricopeptide (TPR) repeat protein